MVKNAHCNQQKTKTITNIHMYLQMDYWEGERECLCTKVIEKYKELKNIYKYMKIWPCMDNDGECVVVLPYGKGGAKQARVYHTHICFCLSFFMGKLFCM